jgi:hypothetical protein
MERTRMKTQRKNEEFGWKLCSEKAYRKNLLTVKEWISRIDLDNNVNLADEQLWNKERISVSRFCM